MGDFYERFVDVEVDAGEAGPLAERMVEWLVSEGVLTRERSAEGMYSSQVRTGYVPGPRWHEAVSDPSDPGWLPGPVAVLVGRDYHVGGQGADEPDAVVCPGCGKRTVIVDYPESFEPDEEAWRRFREAIAVWKETGEGVLACSTCGVPVRLTDWQFASGFDLGALAFDFWGWPPLSVAFREEFRRRLGHRMEEQMGKL
ncbi:hypothetical protein ABT160_27720 [Streptomyces sp. NPDC001941]|uniref:hypothetical protein n=1 Tax=Streptomyces sp. NPDC001941 TaxID=3154659 RepID=UPI00332B686C